MNRALRTLILFALLPTVAGLFLAGCAGPGVSLAPAPPPGAASLFTTPERAFVAQAVARGLYEVQAARLATDRAVHPGVRSYAQMMATDHLQANGELEALLRANAMSVPATLPRELASRLQALRALRGGPEFDRGFVQMAGVEDHLATIALFERARTESVDRDLRAWIERMLPVLRQHLAGAQSLAATLPR